MVTSSQVKHCRVSKSYVQCRLYPLTVHFVLLCLFIFFSFASSGSYADEFVEVAAGHFVRFGAHEDMSDESGHDGAPETRKGIANIGFVIGQRSVVVIDPGGSAADAVDIKAAIIARTTLPISHVILTHFHPDHVLAGQAFSSVPVVVAHRRYTAALAQRGNYYLERFGHFMSTEDKVSWLIPTLIVHNSLTVELGDRDLLIEAYSTAHTDNDLSIYDLKTQTLWASDLVFSERIPSLDGSLTGWLGVLAEMKLKKPSTVIPGHGQAGSWQQTVAPQIQYLENLAALTRKAIMQGVSLAKLTAGISSQGNHDWLLYEQNHVRNITKAYAELEWE